MLVRTGGPGDAARASALFERADAHRDGRPPGPGDAAALERRFADPDALVLLGFVDDRLVATALAAPAREDGGAGARIPGTAHVSLIAVDPPYWGRGFGTAILGELSGRLAGRGYRSLTLSVVAANARARGLYERAGWRPRGEPAPHPRIPELLMQWYERDLETTRSA